MDSIDDRIAAAPLPTPQTVAQRTNLLIQLFRFIAINLKMIRIIYKSH